jgi:hypothetical protein
LVLIVKLILIGKMSKRIETSMPQQVLVQEIEEYGLRYFINSGHDLLIDSCPIQRSQNGTQKLPEIGLFLGNLALFEPSWVAARRSLVENDRPSSFQGTPDKNVGIATAGHKCG